MFQKALNLLKNILTDFKYDLINYMSVSNSSLNEKFNRAYYIID